MNSNPFFLLVCLFAAKAEVSAVVLLAAPVQNRPQLQVFSAGFNEFSL